MHHGISKMDDGIASNSCDGFDRGSILWIDMDKWKGKESSKGVKEPFGSKEDELCGQDTIPKYA